MVSIKVHSAILLTGVTGASAMFEFGRGQQQTGELPAPAQPSPPGPAAAPASALQEIQEMQHTLQEMQKMQQ